MRFCTSPSAVTMISSTRLSDRLRNSIWRMRRLLAARRHHHAGEGGELRQQLRSVADHQLRLIGLDGFLDFGKLAALQGFYGQQGVDEKAGSPAASAHGRPRCAGWR